jgi:uncharacterized protein YifE (UPF0438 family)
MHNDPSVIIGRLNKKIDRLKKQRDFHQQRHQHYAKVISLQPYIEKRWQGYEERIKELERVKQLDKRVKEQEMLIRILAGDKIANYEIDRLYSDMIKQEQKVRNEK